MSDLGSNLALTRVGCVTLGTSLHLSGLLIARHSAGSSCVAAAGSGTLGFTSGSVVINQLSSFPLNLMSLHVALQPTGW